jgi:hypothetical protein
MSEMTHVTDGPGLLVTLEHIKRSKFWPLAYRIWGQQEDCDDIVGDMITEAKKEFLADVNLTENAWDSDENKKAEAHKAIINKVGIEIISAAELARISFNEASYTRILDRAEKDVASAVKNLTTQRTVATIISVQPQMLDPDSDYPDDIADG